MDRLHLLHKLRGGRYEVGLALAEANPAPCRELDTGTLGVK
jgi:hypothetical protein